MIIKNKVWIKRVHILIFLILILYINHSQAVLARPGIGNHWVGTLYEVMQVRPLFQDYVNDINKKYSDYKFVVDYLKDNGYIDEKYTDDDIKELIKMNAGGIKVIYNMGVWSVESATILDYPEIDDNDEDDTPLEQGPIESVDDIIDLADDFFTTGLNNQGKVINIANLQITSNFIYNILLTISIVVAIIWGMVLGIQFLIGSAEQRAETKKALAPYLVGCAVVFGAFGIWAFVVNILQSIN